MALRPAPGFSLIRPWSCCSTSSARPPFVGSRGLVGQRGTGRAITAIATGAAGGPMAALAPLVSRFADVERAKVTITITREGEK